MRAQQKWLILMVIVGGIYGLMACRPESGENVTMTRLVIPEASEETPTPAPTVTPEPPATMAPIEQTGTPMPTEEVTASHETAGSKDLIVCMAGEPESLYLYGSSMYVTQNVQHAIYESLYTQRAYSYQAQGLAKLPNLADGDAVIEAVEVRAGDRVVNASGQAILLADGVTARTAAGDVAVFDGTPLMMEQMQVDFTLKPLVWSDGRPVTAADSVFSFHLAAETESPYGQVDTFQIERTAAYEATGDLTVRWRGLPGWLDPHYFLNVWLPLPQHQLGQYTAAELLDVEETARKPLAHGPFMVTGWTPGEAITLVRNPHYYRAAEGLPYLDSVTFRFVPDANRLATQVLSGRCHIGVRDGIDVSQVPFWREAEAGGLAVFHLQAGMIFEHLDFGINPVDEYAATRPDWFEDRRVRQAIALCTDRQGMVDTALWDASEVWQAYIPGVHPLYPADLAEWAYDVEAANALLDEAGYLDADGDGVRQDPITGVPFRVTLGTTLGSEMRPQVAKLFQQNMLDCGLEVEVALLSADEFFAAGPEGPTFGRRFDLALFAWLTDIDPPCRLYTTAEIPGPAEGWQGNNVTGWSQPEYDAACQAAQQAFPGTPEYVANHQQALRLFAQNVPSIPLFPRLMAAVARPEVKNFGLDPTQLSELWNLFEIDLEQ